MAIIQSELDPTNIARIGSEPAKGLHVISKPLDYDIYGHFNVAVVTGAIGAAMASDGEVFQFRWADTIRMAVIQRVWLTGMRASTAFAVGAIDLKLTRATGWSANGTGGTALTLSDPELSLRPISMSATMVGDIRVATTAALGAGTKTLDAQDMGLVTTHASAGVGAATPIIGSIYLPQTDLFEARVGDNEHPLVLAANEGFVVRAVVPATGVWNLGVAVRWAEVSSF